jgi:hypothetical protein
MKAIRLFRTTVKSKKQVVKLTPQLNFILNSRKWNFDLTDCDRILRIEDENIPLQNLVFMMNEHNHQIVELY